MASIRSEMRQCAVCGDVTERRHLNYGGEACFSCRAFFRRIHQKKTPPLFECRHDGACVVNVASRRRCQRCRYDRCLRAGMKPECVMNETQRKHRNNRLANRHRQHQQQQPKDQNDDPDCYQPLPHLACASVTWVPTTTSSHPTTSSSAFHSAAEVTSTSTLFPSVVSSSLYPAALAAAPVTSQFYLSPRCYAPLPSPARHSVCSAAAANCDLLKALLMKKDDEEEVVPEGLMFSPFVSKVKQDSYPMTKKKLIFERMRREAGQNLYVDTPLNLAHDNALCRSPEQQSSVDALSTRAECDAESETFMAECSSLSSGDGCEDDVQHPWQRFWNRATSGLDPTLKETLLAYHEGRAGPAKTHMREYIFAVSKVFARYAEQFTSEFGKLDATHRNALLMRNTPIFVQYIFARYSSAEESSQKFDWLFVDDGPLVLPHKRCSIEAFRDFSDRVQLFPRARRQDMIKYESLLSKISDHRLTKRVNYLVARACLFFLNSNSVMDAECEKFVRQCQLETRRHAQDRKDIPWSTFEKVLSTLDEAVAFFSRFADFFSSEHVATGDVLEITHCLALPFSRAERHWLQQEVSAIHNVVEAVPFDRSKVAEVLDFHFRERAFSAPGFLGSLRVNMERGRRLLRQHEEFVALSDADQIALLTINGPRVLTLGQCRLEVGDNPGCSWHWFIGESERKLLEGNGGRSYSLAAVNQTGGFVSAAAAERFAYLTRRLKPMLNDDEVFPVLLLVTLFANGHRLSGEAGRRAVTRLQRRYVCTLRRALCCTFGEEYSCVLDECLQELNNCMPELTDIVRQFYGEVHKHVCNC